MVVVVVVLLVFSQLVQELTLLLCLSVDTDADGS